MGDAAFGVEPVDAGGADAPVFVPAVGMGLPPVTCVAGGAGDGDGDDVGPTGVVGGDGGGGGVGVEGGGDICDEKDSTSGQELPPDESPFYFRHSDRKANGHIAKLTLK